MLCDLVGWDRHFEFRPSVPRMAALVTKFFCEMPLATGWEEVDYGPRSSVPLSHCLLSDRPHCGCLLRVGAGNFSTPSAARGAVRRHD